ncbi:hypothetical protein PRZ48_004059 [Zasmidium cellare]|uniref:Fe2OG dioxygenase domain-containing protein n=1 Tax=Zasmidium cellare TaxID=395010 RepID=A0ABR0EWS7_ZASCE|nr:hypothetical protein PRZ48_004059 [Zasmidium cellare]
MATTTTTTTFDETQHRIAVDQKQLPPFPEDLTTAPLLRISLAKLLAKDKEEIQRFERACEELGFFYLDLRGSGDDLLIQADELFGVSQEVFDLPPEEKLKYDFEHLKVYYGYKRLGASVVDQNGNLDRNEFYNISKDDILEIGQSWPSPKVIHSQRALIRSFITSADAVVTLLLELLNEQLGLPHGTLASMHRLQEPSGNQVRMIKALPQEIDEGTMSAREHTDFGSVTVLFNRLGGLQILPPVGDWCYVKPLPGHAIINLGDAMVKFSNGLLRSNIHRVVSPPGAQARSTRYSLVYFSRPEDNVVLRRLANGTRIPPLEDGVEEEQITSKEWIAKRALRPRTAIYGKDAVCAADGTETISRRQ